MRARRLLALCAHLAATLPYRRADEPLTLLRGLDALLARRADDALSSLRASLQAAPDARTPPQARCRQKIQ
jgi:hypothetical protein